MPVDIEGLLSTALEQIRSEREHDTLEARFKALEQRRPQLAMADVMAALEGASDEELDALQATVLGGMAADVADDRDEDKPDEPEPAKPKAKTRPGRKAGQAYDWYVDDDSGEVLRSDTALIYSGEDEPDEVPLSTTEEE